LTAVLQGITYQRETLSPYLIDEVLPLLAEHFKEVDPFPQYPLDPDWVEYLRFEDAGHLRVYTARDAHDSLIGYMAAFVRNDPHHRTSKRATQDVFFIRKERRGFGLEFLLWCNSQLKAEGIEIDFQHVSVNCDWGKMASRAGYTCVETVWAKVQ